MNLNDIIKILLEHGANPLEGSTYGTPFSIACDKMNHFKANKRNRFEEEEYNRNSWRRFEKEIEINLWKPIVEMLYKAIKGIPLYKEIDVPESEFALEAISPSVIKDMVLIADEMNKNHKIEPDNKSHFQSTTSAIQMDSAGEIIMINAILDKTLNADIFINALKDFGFKFENESFMGLQMESEYGRILLKMKVSIHPTDIATLLYLDKKTEKEIYLVEDGIRC